MKKSFFANLFYKIFWVLTHSVNSERDVARFASDTR